MSIKFSQEEAEPHTQVDVMVTADSMSQVNLLAVDQSVLLLKSGNDITVKEVGLFNETFVSLLLLQVG